MHGHISFDATLENPTSKLYNLPESIRIPIIRILDPLEPIRFLLTKHDHRAKIISPKPMPLIMQLLQTEQDQQSFKIPEPCYVSVVFSQSTLSPTARIGSSAGHVSDGATLPETVTHKLGQAQLLR